jgi:hypothetical protein
LVPLTALIEIGIAFGVYGLVNHTKSRLAVLIGAVMGLVAFTGSFFLRMGTASYFFVLALNSMALFYTIRRKPHEQDALISAADKTAVEIEYIHKGK